MPTLNKLSIAFLILNTVFIHLMPPLSIGQSVAADSGQIVEFLNPSFESLRSVDLSGGINIQTEGLPIGWYDCNYKNETPPDIQPGNYNVRLTAQQGRNYMGLIARDNGAWEAIRQKLEIPLRADVCYRLSVYLAKSTVYERNSRLTGKKVLYNHPLKLVLWGLNHDSCDLQQSDWLAETLPVHNDNWRRYTFFIQPPKEVRSLVFSAAHVVDKPYNGNILIDNFSPVVAVNCVNFTRLASGSSGQKGALLLMQQINDLISQNGNQMKFAPKGYRLLPDGVSKAENTVSKDSNVQRTPFRGGEGGTIEQSGQRHIYFDNLLSFFERYPNYKLVIRIKGKKTINKNRIAYLYSYIFRHTNLKAQQVDIQRFSTKDDYYFWTFENDDFAMSFDSM
jgi:hypothetical protein